jgi:hypothetical protein
MIISEFLVPMHSKEFQWASDGAINLGCDLAGLRFGAILLVG